MSGIQATTHTQCMSLCLLASKLGSSYTVASCNNAAACSHMLTIACAAMHGLKISGNSKSKCMLKNLNAPIPSPAHSHHVPDTDAMDKQLARFCGCDGLSVPTEPSLTDNLCHDGLQGRGGQCRCSQWGTPLVLKPTVQW